MKLLKTTLLLAVLLSSIIACNNPETATDETTTQETTKQETTEPATPPPVVKKQKQHTTFEEFWTAIQVAVANKDKETLKQFSRDKAGVTSLIEDHYAPLVAKIKVTDFKKSSRQENGKKMYEYMMSMNYEGVEEENLHHRMAVVIKGCNGRHRTGAPGWKKKTCTIAWLRA